jgi:hypothetical protein
MRTAFEIFLGSQVLIGLFIWRAWWITRPQPMGKPFKEPFEHPRYFINLSDVPPEHLPAPVSYLDV